MRSYAQSNPWFSPPAIQYVATFGNPPQRNSRDERLRTMHRQSMQAPGDLALAGRLGHQLTRTGAATMSSLGLRPGMRIRVTEEWPRGWPKAYLLKAGVWELERPATGPNSTHVFRPVSRTGKVSKAAKGMRPVDPEEFDQAVSDGIIVFVDDAARPGAAPKASHETTKAERKALSDAIHHALQRTYFRDTGEAVGAVFDALVSVGFEMDGNPGPPFWDRNGNWRALVSIARRTNDPFAPQAIDDTQVNLQFHQMDSGRVEAVGYMTVSNPGHALSNPLLAVVGNPPGGDEGIRSRGRAHSGQPGDLQAMMAYEASQARSGSPPYERIYLRDALERYQVIPRDGSMPDFSVIAAAIRKLLKQHKIKGVSVTTPRHAGANSIDLSRPKGARLPAATAQALADLFGVRADRDSLSLYPGHSEDATDWQSDYHWPAGPNLRWQDATLLAQLIQGEAPQPAQWAPALGFQTGQVVKFAGKRQKRRYVVTSVEQFAQDGDRRYSMIALSGGPRGSRPSGAPEADLELDADQSLPAQFENYQLARQAEPVAWRQVSVGVLPDGRAVVHAHYKRTGEVRKALQAGLGLKGMIGLGGTMDAPVLILPAGVDSGDVVSALIDGGFQPSSPPSSVDEPRSVWLENPGGCPCYNARTGEVRAFHGLSPAQATQRAAYEENPHHPVPTIPVLNHVRTGDWCAHTGRLENARDRKDEALALWWARMLDTVTVALTQYARQQGGMGIASMTRAQWLDRFAQGKSKGAQDKMWSDLLKWLREQDAAGYAIRATNRPGWLDLNISNTYDAAWLANQGTLHQRGLPRERELLRQRYAGIELAGRIADREDFWDELDYDEESGDPELSESEYRESLEYERQSRLAAQGGTGSVQGRDNPHERTWRRPAEQEYDVDEFRDHPQFDAAWNDVVEFHGGSYEPSRVTVYEVDDGKAEETWAPMHAYLHELEDLTYTVPDRRSNKHQGAHPDDYPSSLRGEPGLWVHKFKGKVGAGPRSKLARPIVAKVGGAQALTTIPRGGGISDWYHS